MSNKKFGLILAFSAVSLVSGLISAFGGGWTWDDHMLFLTGFFDGN